MRFPTILIDNVVNGQSRFPVFFSVEVFLLRPATILRPFMPRGWQGDFGGGGPPFVAYRFRRKATNDVVSRVVTAPPTVCDVSRLRREPTGSHPWRA